MTQMSFRRCSRSLADKRYKVLFPDSQGTISEHATDFTLLNEKEKLSPEELALRTEILEAEEESMKAISGATDRQVYLFNLNFGARLYNLLAKKGFGTWEASEIGVWGRISLYVVPDVVARHSENGVSPGRYYGRATRLWLNTIWWFIHLVMIPQTENSSLCNIEETVKLMEPESQDYLQGLVEHTGVGYRVEFTRSMARVFRRYVDDNKISDGKRAIFFREYIKEFQLRANVVDPDIEGAQAFLDSFATRVVKKVNEYRKGKREVVS